MSGETQAGMDPTALEKALADDATRKKLEELAPKTPTVPPPLATMRASAGESPTPTPVVLNTRERERRDFAGRMAQALLASQGASITEAQGSRLMATAVMLADRLQMELDKAPRR